MLSKRAWSKHHKVAVSFFSVLDLESVVLFIESDGELSQAYCWRHRGLVFLLNNELKAIYPMTWMKMNG